MIMDETIRKALKRRQEIMKELYMLNNFIATYEDLTGDQVDDGKGKIPAEIVDTGENSKNSGEFLNLKQKVNILNSHNSKKRRNNIRKLLDVCDQIISEANTPLTRYELVEGIEKMGIEIYATNPPKYIGTLLWRNQDRFVSVEDGYITISMYNKSIIEGAREEIESEAVDSYNEERRLMENYERDVKGVD